MLASEDHVGGERSCWWEIIMLVEKEHVGGKGSCGCCKMVNYCKSMIFAPEKSICSQNGLPCVRSQHKSQQTICLLAAHLFPIKNSARKRPYVKVTSKKYVVEVLLNLFLFF